MFSLAVVTETLPVVGEEHDQRLIVDAEIAQFVEKIADHCVGRRHLTVVRRLVARRVLGRRVVGGVGLEDVEEQKERPIGDRSQPGLHGLEGLAARALDGLDPRTARVRPELDSILVKLETGFNTRRPAENESRNPSTRRVACVLQRLLEQGLTSRVDCVSQIVPHAVIRWKQPRQ